MLRTEQATVCDKPKLTISFTNTCDTFTYTHIRTEGQIWLWPLHEKKVSISAGLFCSVHTRTGTSASATDIHKYEVVFIWFELWLFK